MAAAARPPTVSLEAGIGPANPPCPVCGEPLFGWAKGPGAAAVRRCEACGLGVVGEPGDEREVRDDFERRRVEGSDTPRYRIPNRGSLAAWLGGSGWASIEPGARYLPTPEAVRRLIAARDQRLQRVRWRPGAGIAAMWGTLLNSFTFGHNVALALVGSAVARPAARGWQRWLDGFISVITVPVLLLVSVLLEVGAGLSGRGGELELTLALD